MIVSIPFVLSLTNYATLAEKLRNVGPYGTHTLHVIAQPQESEAATEFFDAIKDLFHTSALHYLRPDSRKSIRLSNDLFHTAAAAASRHQITNGEVVGCPFMYYDPTRYPIAKEWAELVQVEWFKNAKAVLGCPVTAPDVSVMSSGREVKVQGGIRFNGHIIINKDFWEKSGLINNLSPAVHWRDSLRYELAASHAVSILLGKGTTSLFKSQRVAKIPEPPKNT